MFLFPTRIHPQASVGVKSHKLLQNNERENKGKTKVKKGSRKDSIEKQVRNEKLKLGSSKEERKDRYMLANCPWREVLERVKEDMPMNYDY